MLRGLTFGLFLVLLLGGCHDNAHNDSDAKQRQQQEAILDEGTAAVGMPAIKNFRERRLLKDIFELRDQELVTYTYLATLDGHLVFFCDSIGYGIPYATQFTSPEKPMWTHGSGNGGNITLPQADPNTLFSPASADGTWVMCADPHGDRTSPSPVFVEPRIIVAPFRLDTPRAERPAP